MLVFGGGGLVLVLTQAGRADPLWRVWASLALAVCVTSGAIFIYGLHRWSELKSIQPVSAGRVWTLVSMVAAVGVIGVNAPRLLPDATEGNWRNGVLLSLSIVASLPAAAAMYGVRDLVVGPVDRLGSGDQLAAMLTLRRLLQRLLTVVGWLPALVTFQTGALIALEKNLQNAFGNQPPQYLLVVGGFGSVLVALVYVPPRSALRAQASRLCDELFPLQSITSPAKILDTVDARQKVEQTLGMNGTVAADLQAGLIILSPLITSATASFLPK
jgi:hypothetical protein